MRTTCCQPIGKNCGTLHYDSRCPACSVAASLVRLADLRGSITLQGSDIIPVATFFRNINGSASSHSEDSLFGEVVAELLGVDRFPGQRILNDFLRILLNVGRAVVVWSHGEKVSLQAVLGRPKTLSIP